MGKFFKLLTLTCVLYQSQCAADFTANRVWFQYHIGFYRVIVHYTVPELKQLRAVTFDTVNKRKAEKFYFSLLRGAHFRVSDNNTIDFVKQASQPRPW